LSGDAGGFLLEMTGEGILLAIISGEEVGRIILRQRLQA